MTDLEKNLIEALGVMVQQHCDHDKKEVYETGFIATNKDALTLLVRVGVMEEKYPEQKYGIRWERLFYAKFVENWLWKLWREKLVPQKLAGEMEEKDG